MTLLNIGLNNLLFINLMFIQIIMGVSLILARHFIFQVVKDYKDFALSDYARVGRAIALYEVGDNEEAIAEMEDVSISLKGYPGNLKYILKAL